jgi:chromosome segregation ATPase
MTAMPKEKIILELQAENLTLKSKISGLEDTVRILNKTIDDLKVEIEDEQWNTDEYLCAWHEAREKLEYCENREQKLTKEIEQLRDENTILKEFQSTILNWREIIPDRENENAQKIYHLICDLNKSFHDCLLHMARLYKENPSEELDKILNPEIVSVLKGSAAAMLNRFRID